MSSYNAHNGFGGLGDGCSSCETVSNDPFMNTNNISGPFSIAEFSGKSLSMGAVYFAYLLAILSISLGVLNLLPIPVLDGGHLVYYTIEMLTGHPVSEKIQLIAQQFGLIILFGIMILAFYNDYMRLVG